MQSARELLRPAQMIHAIYEKRRHHPIREQSSAWTRLERWMDVTHRLRRGFVKAQAHGWHFAASQIQGQLAAVLEACKDGANAMHAECLETVIPTPSLAHLLAELDQMHAEFDPVLIDTKHRTLAIHTDTIVLEEVSLGPFLVRLNWTQLTQPTIGCFDILALKPNYSSGDDRVPHPHVRNQKLCAGDATVPVQHALEQGRLVDAFHLVCAVLETYNSGSAYIPLSDWEGVECWNCNSPTTQEDRSFCEGCDHDVCDVCVSSCKHCDRTRCSSCIGQCDDCEEYCCRLCLKKSAKSDLLLCKDCLRACVGCGAKVAAKELDMMTKLCAACHDAQPDEETPVDSERILSPSLEGDSRCDLNRRQQRGPRLTFAALAWAKLQFFCHAGNTEIAGFGIAAKNNLLYVEDFITVRQYASSMTVKMDDHAVADFTDRCVDAGLPPQRFLRIWCHTHPGTSPMPSGTDEETFARVFGACDWAVMFIVSRTANTYARLSFHTGPRMQVNMPVNVDWSTWPSVLSDLDTPFVSRLMKWQNEFAEHIQPFPQPPPKLPSISGVLPRFTAWGPLAETWGLTDLEQELWEDYELNEHFIHDDGRP